jgi:predicted polyphosphate/ATP-dependent NAD kinase
LYATALGLVEPTYIQVGKEMFSEMSDTAVKDEIAEHLSDEMKKHSDTLFLFGAGGTIDYIAQKLGFDNTVLGIDAVFQGKTLEQDVNEQRILRLLEMYPKTMIIISPIGAQGFIFGRGNLPFSPDVIRKIGLDNIIVIATPAKMISTQLLRVDTGDMSLDKEFADYGMMMVVIGYRMSRVVRIQAV